VCDEKRSEEEEKGECRQEKKGSQEEKWAEEQQVLESSRIWRLRFGGQGGQKVRLTPASDRASHSNHPDQERAVWRWPAAKSHHSLDDMPILGFTENSQYALYARESYRPLQQVVFQVSNEQITTHF
jgi:hypothetical protein